MKNYWNIVPPAYLAERHVTITIINLAGSKTPQDDEGFKFIAADACDLSIPRETRTSSLVDSRIE